MTEIVPLDEVSTINRGGVISIGNFDGVHRGHAALLKQVRRLADQMGGPALAIVLDPHPAAILRPSQLPARLSWIERRAERMATLGIDFLVVCKTTPEFLQLSAETFFESLVLDQLAAQAIVEGPNFFFGRDRGGNIEKLKQLCRHSQIDLAIVDPTTTGSEMISSTRIRNLLAESKVEQAADLLGCPHRIRGRVIAGAGRGRTIGFPTANLAEVDVVTPAHGVYGGLATWQGRRWQAAIHIGPSPTFETDGLSKIEVHLLDFSDNLYGQSLLVDFNLHVREIARFDSAPELTKQLTGDIQTIRSGLAPFRLHES
ncbi:MAG: riboflavin biosynthesis protein RibF [Pirellulales bacterium]|nr:riboflavin biosynthesis protein RibF [Pirellulales bacterium]